MLSVLCRTGLYDVVKADWLQQCLVSSFCSTVCLHSYLCSFVHLTIPSVKQHIHLIFGILLHHVYGTSINIGTFLKHYACLPAPVASFMLTECVATITLCAHRASASDVFFLPNCLGRRSECSISSPPHAPHVCSNDQCVCSALRHGESSPPDIFAMQPNSSGGSLRVV